MEISCSDQRYELDLLKVLSCFTSTCCLSLSHSTLACFIPRSASSISLNLIRDGYIPRSSSISLYLIRDGYTASISLKARLLYPTLFFLHFSLPHKRWIYSRLLYPTLFFHLALSLLRYGYTRSRTQSEILVSILS